MDSASLASKYDDIEKNIDHLFVKPTSQACQYFETQKKLIKTIRNRSLDERLDPYLYEERITTAFDVLSNIKSSLSAVDGGLSKSHWSLDKQKIWFHQEDAVIGGFAPEENDPVINREELLTATSEYLIHSWMQIKRLDWMLLNALLFIELYSFRGAVFSGLAFGEINWRNLISGRDPKKIVLTSLLLESAKFFARYIVPPLIITGLYFLHFEKAFWGVGGIYLVYLLIKLVFWPSRYLEKKKKEQRLKKAESQILKMVRCYHFCKDPVVSPRALLQQIEEATTLEVNYDGALFSLLDRIIAKNKVMLTPWYED